MKFDGHFMLAGVFQGAVKTDFALVDIKMELIGDS